MPLRKVPDLFVFWLYQKGAGAVDEAPTVVDPNSGNSVTKAFRSWPFKYRRDFQLSGAINEAPAVIHTNSGQALTKPPATVKAWRNNKATREIYKS